MTRPIPFQTTDSPPWTPGCEIRVTSFSSFRVFKVSILEGFFGGKTKTSEILFSVAVRLRGFFTLFGRERVFCAVEK